MYVAKPSMFIIIVIIISSSSSNNNNNNNNNTFLHHNSSESVFQEAVKRRFTRLGDIWILSLQVT